MKLPGFLANAIKYQEDLGYVLPSSLAASIIFLIIILDIILGNYPEERKGLIIIGIGIWGSAYVFLQTLLVVPRIQKYRTLYNWANAAISALGLSLPAVALGETHHIYFDTLFILAVTSIATLSGRGPQAGPDTRGQDKGADIPDQDVRQELPGPAPVHHQAHERGGDMGPLADLPP